VQLGFEGFEDFEKVLEIAALAKQLLVAERIKRKNRPVLSNASNTFLKRRRVMTCSFRR
jgi:hypothetical protein